MILGTKFEFSFKNLLILHYLMLKIENLEAKMVLGATGILCLFAPLGATGPRFSSSESFRGPNKYVLYCPQHYVTK